MRYPDLAHTCDLPQQVRYEVRAVHDHLGLVIIHARCVGLLRKKHGQSPEPALDLNGTPTHPFRLGRYPSLWAHPARPATAPA